MANRMRETPFICEFYTVAVRSKSMIQYYLVNESISTETQKIKLHMNKITKTCGDNSIFSLELWSLFL